MSGARLTAAGLAVARGGRTLCHGIDLALGAGQCWGILGANGVGKTTLLHTLAGLLPPAAGTLTLDGRPLAGWPRRAVARRLGLLLQESHDPFPSTVLEGALIGRHPHLRPWEAEAPEDLACAHAALAAMELETLATRPVATLSGGERRRLAVATLLTQAPAILLLDEPTNHLDPRHQRRVLAHLRGLADAGRAVAMTLHDINLAARYCDHLLLLFEDGHAEAGPADALLEAATLGRLYGEPVAVIEAQGRRAFLPE